jgi:putative transposase
VTFIDAHRDRVGVEPICRTLGIAPSTYYVRKTRPPSRRELDGAVLLERIHAVHEQNFGV